MFQTCLKWSCTEWDDDHDDDDDDDDGDDDDDDDDDDDVPKCWTWDVNFTNLKQTC